MTTRVHIYKPARTAMQSGQARTNSWVIEHQCDDPLYIEPLMSWTGSKTTKPQVRLSFANQEEAIRFAQSQGWDYQISQPNSRSLKPKSYMDAILRR